MASSPVLGDRGIETASFVTGDGSSGISLTTVSDVVLARELFRNLDSDSPPSLCFLDCVRGPTRHLHDLQLVIRN